MLARMSVLYDYFAASSDEAAAAAIDLPAGPAAAADGSFDTVPGNGIDPVVQLGTLEALLTGRDYDEILQGRPRAGPVLASRDGGRRLVVTLTRDLQAALSQADHARLADVATPWCQTEELSGQGDPGLAAAWLDELAGLARRATTRGERLYCWVCV
jgi:hypothetical protein